MISRFTQKCSKDETNKTQETNTSACVMHSIWKILPCDKISNCKLKITYYTLNTTTFWMLTCDQQKKQYETCPLSVTVHAPRCAAWRHATRGSWASIVMETNYPRRWLPDKINIFPSRNEYVQASVPVHNLYLYVWRDRNVSTRFSIRLTGNASVRLCIWALWTERMHGASHPTGALRAVQRVQPSIQPAAGESL